MGRGRSLEAASEAEGRLFRGPPDYPASGLHQRIARDAQYTFMR